MMLRGVLVDTERSNLSVYRKWGLKVVSQARHPPRCGGVRNISHRLFWPCFVSGDLLGKS